VGQLPDLTPLEGSGISVNGGRVIEADPETLATTRKGIFAAEQIDSFLGGNGDISETLTSPAENEPARPVREARGKRQRRPRKLESGQRLKGFDVEELPLDLKEAAREAQRCLRCDLAYPVEEYNLDTVTCIFCGRCTRTCYWEAIAPDIAYDTTMVERHQERERVERQHRVYNFFVTALVILISALMVAIIYNLFVNS
jgi:ferredoxin